MDQNEQIFELITKINNGMTRLYDEIKDIKTEVKNIKFEVGDIKTEVSSIKTEVNDIKTEVKDIKTEVSDIKTEVKDIQMTLENEINKNIRIIAEGHVNLNRKLDESLKIESEKEMMLIRITSLENEVRRLKARIEEIT